MKNIEKFLTLVKLQMPAYVHTTADDKEWDGECVWRKAWVKQFKGVTYVLYTDSGHGYYAIMEVCEEWTIPFVVNCGKQYIVTKDYAFVGSSYSGVHELDVEEQLYLNHSKLGRV